MNFYEKSRYQHAWINRLRTVEWENPFAVTLTFKPTVRAPEGARLKIDLDSADRNVEHLINKLRCELFSPKERKSGATVYFAAVAEKTAGGPWHYHLVIDVPASFTHINLGRYLAKTWPQTTWGDKQIDVQPMTDGWIDYICKLRSKKSYDEAFRVNIFRLPP